MRCSPHGYETFVMIEAFFRQFIPPTLGARLPASPAAAGATGGLIPAAELQKLNADLPVQTIEQPGGAVSFEGALARVVPGVSAPPTTAPTAAAAAVRGLTTGQTGSLQQALISMEDANVSFQLMIEVRTKLLESYQELMRMQI